MVQVQSSWFPLIDRNPQTFCDIPNAKPEQFRTARHELVLAPTTPSRIELSVVEAK